MIRQNSAYGRLGSSRRPAVPSAGRLSWWRHPALIAGVAALVLYAPGLGGGWLRDDHPLIERHPYLRAGGWLGRLLLGDFWAPVLGATGMWRPTVVASYWIDGRLSGWTPLWFHVVNAASHALTGSVLALLLLRLGAGAMGATLGALWFAAMPAHAESVAWVSGRTDLFCTLFGLLALWLDARAAERGRRGPGVLAPLALFVSLASKEAAVTLVAVFAAVEWQRRATTGRSLAASAMWLAPYLLVTAVYLVAHRAFVPDPGVIAVTDPESRIELRRAAWALLPGYLAFLWPWFAHSPDRAAPHLASSWQAEIAIGAVVAAALVVLAAVLLLRRSRYAAPVVLFLAPLAPPLVLASSRGYGLFGERHVYLPSAGAAWALALAWPWLAGATRGGRASWSARRVAAFAGVAALIAGSAIATLRILPAYHDDESMYRVMTEREPDNPTGFVGLAGLYVTDGRIDPALPLLATAERMDPGMASVHVVRGQIAARRQDWAGVLAASERALALAPQLPSARLLRALALLRTGRMAESGAMLDALAREFPADQEAAAVRGQYLIAAGRIDEALPVLEGAAAALDRDPGVWDALGFARARAGRTAEARAAFAHVVALSPDYLEGWMRLAAVCQQLGDAPGRDQALAHAAALPGGRARVEAMLARLGARPPS